MDDLVDAEVPLHVLELEGHLAIGESCGGLRAEGAENTVARSVAPRHGLHRRGGRDIHVLLEVEVDGRGAVALRGLGEDLGALRDVVEHRVVSVGRGRAAVADGDGAADLDVSRLGIGQQDALDALLLGVDGVLVVVAHAADDHGAGCLHAEHKLHEVLLIGNIAVGEVGQAVHGAHLGLVEVVVRAVAHGDRGADVGCGLRAGLRGEVPRRVHVARAQDEVAQHTAAGVGTDAGLEAGAGRVGVLLDLVVVVLGDALVVDGRDGVGVLRGVEAVVVALDGCDVVRAVRIHAAVAAQAHEQRTVLVVVAASRGIAGRLERESHVGPGLDCRGNRRVVVLGNLHAVHEAVALDAQPVGQVVVAPGLRVVVRPGSVGVGDQLREAAKHLVQRPRLHQVCLDVVSHSLLRPPARCRRCCG